MITVIPLESLSKEQINAILSLYGEPEKIVQTDQKEAVQTHLGIDASRCFSDIDKTPLPDSANHSHKTHPQSAFEIFCDRQKIDPLTLGKKGLRQISQEFAQYRNQIRERIGGRKIPRSQVYKDVRDYIEDRRLCFYN